jgi:hypothetical protein
MQRKEAEKILAALIFDDLDEVSKTELLAYLQNDNDLRERLADMRMAVKVASDTVQHGPDPVLGRRRLKRLAKLARHARTRPTIFTVRRLAAAAAAVIIIAMKIMCALLLASRVPLMLIQNRLLLVWRAIKFTHTQQSRGSNRVNMLMTQWLKVKWLRIVRHIPGWARATVMVMADTVTTGAADMAAECMVATAV